MADAEIDPERSDLCQRAGTLAAAELAIPAGGQFDEVRGWRQGYVEAADGLQVAPVTQGFQGKQRTLHVGLQQQRAVRLLLPELLAVSHQFGGVMAQPHVQAGDALARLCHHWPRGVVGHLRVWLEYLEPRPRQAHALHAFTHRCLVFRGIAQAPVLARAFEGLGDDGRGGLQVVAVGENGSGAQAMAIECLDHGQRVEHIAFEHLQLVRCNLGVGQQAPVVLGVVGDHQHRQAAFVHGRQEPFKHGRVCDMGKYDEWALHGSFLKAAVARPIGLGNWLLTRRARFRSGS
ncbi:hypothetical protein D3C79_762710 [compost metagenome]